MSVVVIMAIGFGIVFLPFFLVICALWSAGSEAEDKRDEARALAMAYHARELEKN